MRRKYTILSPLSIMLSIALFTGLGITIWRSEGLAFSPGKLSAKSQPGKTWGGYSSHADFEKECRACHQPLKSRQADLCLECHTEVASEIARGSAVHGALEREPLLRCYECHSDHQGRDFDPIKDALARFDHSLTNFDLIWHQVNYDATPMDCTACHTIGREFSFSAPSCFDCHTGRDAEFMARHRQDFPGSCIDCHDGKDRMVDFDHATTAFALEGKHVDTRCAACHLNGQFQGTTIECIACHTEPEVHRGLFGQDCADCHNPSAWVPALVDGEPFDHHLQSAFSLVRHAQDYQGQPLTCQGCHQSDVNTIDLGACVACHADHDAQFMNQHVEQFSLACLDCHDGVDRMRGFDHSNVFALDGRHGEVACQACHTPGAQGKVFKDTPKECVQCHAEPEIHAGFFGLQCQYCHTTSAWLPAHLRLHPFPLDHGEQGEIACQICHIATYVVYTCYGCHEHQEQEIAASHSEKGISLAELPNCTGCHPTGKKEKDEADD